MLFFGSLVRGFRIHLALCCLVPCVEAQVLKVAFGSEPPSASAFVIGQGKEAMTLVVAGNDMQRVRLEGVATAVSATVSDPVSRLVVFRTNGSFGSGFHLASSASVGGLLRVPGESMQMRIEASVKQVDGKYLPFTLLRIRHAGAALEPGMPLLDASGRVAAVAHGPAGRGVFDAIPAEVLNRVLEASRQGEVRRVWLGLVLRPESGAARVERVVPESPAVEAGLLAGDLLLEIGGKRLHDYGDAVNAFYLLRPGSPQPFKVRRGGVDIVTKLTPSVSSN